MPEYWSGARFNSYIFKSWKNLFFLLHFLVVVTVLSCGKDKNDNPGNISGVGNTEDDLEVDGPIFFPIGLSLVGDIIGFKANSGTL